MSSLAVLPSSSLRRCGSCRPGTCTRMRSTPWRWISGSTVPSSLTRRSTIWIDCSTDWRMRSVIAGSRHGEPDQPAAGIGDIEAALAGGAEQAAERLRQLAQLGQRLLAIVAFADADFDACCRGSPPLPGCRARSSRSTRRTSSRNWFELLLAHRRWHRPRAGGASRPADRGRARCAAAPISARSCTALGEEIRNGEKAHDQRRENDRQRLPPREIQHRLTRRS